MNIFNARKYLKEHRSHSSLHFEIPVFMLSEIANQI